MRVILFDLGDTLEFETQEHKDVLLPGALEMLMAVQALQDTEGAHPALALISDFDDRDNTGEIAGTTAQIKLFRKQYLKLLAALGLDFFFEPHAERVTLSIEAGVRKPDKKIFRMAIDKIHAGLPFHDVIFITENAEHIAEARKMGITGIKFRAPGQQTGDVSSLSELMPLIKRFLEFATCGRRGKDAAKRTDATVQKSKQQDPKIQSLVGEVKQDRLRQSVSELVSFKTRWSFSPQISKVPEWIHNQFVALGYTAGNQVRYQPFVLPGSTQQQRNVLCGPPHNSQKFVLVCCHYDSISEKSSVSAPGADDNASGVAATIELARILRNVPLTQRAVLFAAFGGEEQGLFGSSACAEVAVSQGWPIDLVINMDMISYKDPGGASRIIVEYDQGNKNPANDAAAKSYAMTMAQAAADYTSLAVEHTNIWNSDYIPFETKGFACIGVYNAYENPYYHKSSDTLAKIDLPNFTEAVRMILATLLILCA
jgi:FMN phosphatase YigB (HAD superfamily)